MATAQADLPDLKALLSQLQAFNASLTAEWNRLKASWSQLDAEWHDQQKAKFRKDWEQTLREMERYIQKSSDYVSFLQARIRAIEEFEG